MVNSFFFNPLTERDGVWLKNSDNLEVQENRNILENAVELYKNLISQIKDLNFFNLYNIVETRLPSTNGKYFDEHWYEYYIQKPEVGHFS